MNCRDLTVEIFLGENVSFLRIPLGTSRVPYSVKLETGRAKEARAMREQRHLAQWCAGKCLMTGVGEWGGGPVVFAHHRWSHVAPSIHSTAFAPALAGGLHRAV